MRTALARTCQMKLELRDAMIETLGVELGANHLPWSGLLLFYQALLRKGVTHTLAANN